jgi:predicted enzyme related to lactoylglutathione lyase
MSEQRLHAGEIAWLDLTVEDADAARDFYAEVIGWTITPVDMGGYDDYCMNVPATGNTVSGVCFARASNADLPPVWLAYVVVEDLDQSMARCREHGGSIVAGPKSLGPEGRYCVVKDPAGAVLALYQYTDPSNSE